MKSKKQTYIVPVFFRVKAEHSWKAEDAVEAALDEAKFAGVHDLVKPLRKACVGIAIDPKSSD